MPLHEKNYVKKFLDCLENETNEIFIEEKIAVLTRKISSKNGRNWSLDQ